jgi:hypothetical protein
MRVAISIMVGLSLLGPSIAMAKKDRNDHEEMGNPTRVICRSEEEIGSRLSRVKRCHTAAEWALIKRENRLTIDRVQAFKPSSGN